MISTEDEVIALVDAAHHAYERVRDEVFDRLEPGAGLDLRKLDDQQIGALLDLAHAERAAAEARRRYDA